MGLRGHIGGVWCSNQCASGGWWCEVGCKLTLMWQRRCESTWQRRPESMWQTESMQQRRCQWVDMAKKASRHGRRSPDHGHIEVMSQCWVEESWVDVASSGSSCSFYAGIAKTGSGLWVVDEGVEGWWLLNHLFIGLLVGELGDTMRPTAGINSQSDNRSNRRGFLVTPGKAPGFFGQTGNSVSRNDLGKTTCEMSAIPGWV